MPRPQQRESRARVPLSWEALNGTAIPEADFLEMVRQIPMPRVLPSLISLLQYGDASEPPAYEILDQRVRDLFPTETARRIADELERQGHWMFFSKWQLLLTIKLICAFGSRDAHTPEVSSNQLLKFLLMVNGLYPGGEDAPDTPEGAIEAVQEAILRGYASFSMRTPMASSAGTLSSSAGCRHQTIKPSSMLGWTFEPYWGQSWAYNWMLSRRSFCAVWQVYKRRLMV